MNIDRRYETTRASYDWNDPQFVVVHYTAGAWGVRAEDNAIYYSRAAEQIQASAHYFLGNDGIFSFTPEYRGAWTNGNWEAGHHSVTIEVACGTDEPGFTENEISMLAELVQDIMARHGIPAENVIRHYDVADRFSGYTADPHKLCPRQYIDQSAWEDLHARITGGGDMPRVEDIWEYNWQGTAPGGNMYNTAVDTNAVVHKLAEAGGASIDYDKLAGKVADKIGDGIAAKVADMLAKRLAE